jgi:hypothetical protein
VGWSERAPGRWPWHKCLMGSRFSLFAGEEASVEPRSGRSGKCVFLQGNAVNVLPPAVQEPAISNSHFWLSSGISVGASYDGLFSHGISIASLGIPHVAMDTPAGLPLTVGDPPTQTEVQTVVNKLNALINALQREFERSDRHQSAEIGAPIFNRLRPNRNPQVTNWNDALPEDAGEWRTR